MKIHFTKNIHTVDFGLGVWSPMNKKEYGQSVATYSHWDFELFSSSNHISPLLNRPQGCQGCQKNRKDLRFHT